MQVQSALPGGGASVSVGTAAPSSPKQGDLWWDTNGGHLYIYYNDGTSSQWVAADANTGALSTGISGHNVPYLDGANTWSAVQVISTAGAGDIQLRVISTDATATPGPQLTNAGPYIDLYRNVSVPTGGTSVIGVLRFLANNNTGGVRAFGQAQILVTDSTNGAEDSGWVFYDYLSGSLTAELGLGGGTGGLVVYGPGSASPTGGYKGLGTVNVQSAYWENGVALTSKYAQLGISNSFTGTPQTIAPSAGAANLNLNPNAATQQAMVNYYQTGVVKWALGKQTDDSFLLYDSVAATGVISIPSNGSVINFLRPTSISMSGTGNALTLTSTDAGAGDAPDLRLYRNSASPAALDLLSQINFDGRNSTPADANYGKIYAQIIDPTGGGTGNLIVQTLRAGTVKTAATFTDTVQIAGVTDASAPGTGIVGEYLTNSGSGVGLTSNVAANLTSISLTAGDWDVWGVSSVSYSATGINNIASLSTTSATHGGVNQTYSSAAAFNAYAHSVAAQRFNVSTTTTVYLVVSTNFGSGTATGSGWIYARRRR